MYGTRACLNIYRTVWKELKKEHLESFMHLSYKGALKQLSSSTLYERREDLCMKTMKRIEESSSRLSRLLPFTRDSDHGLDLRNKSNRTPFFCRTIRYQNSFFPALGDKLNTNELEDSAQF